MPPPLFVFGSLRDPDVLGVVLGRGAHGVERVPASLPGYRVARLPDESYPVLMEAPGHRAEGLLLYGLRREHFHRIAFFESYEYEFRRCRVALEGSRTTEALFCSEGKTAPGARETWSLESWQRHHKAAFLEDTRRYMQMYGNLSAEEADAEWIRWKRQ